MFPDCGPHGAESDPDDEYVLEVQREGRQDAKTVPSAEGAKQGKYWRSTVQLLHSNYCV